MHQLGLCGASEACVAPACPSADRQLLRRRSSLCDTTGRALFRSEPLDASRQPVEAAMKLGEQTPPAVDDSPRGGPEEIVRAVLDFQRGADREKNFELLFRRFRPRIERFLASRVFSPEERLDLTQMTFLRIYQGLEGYRGEGSLEGWVLRIAFNVYRKWRDRQPGGRQAVPEIPFEGLPGAPEPSPSAAGPIALRHGLAARSHRARGAAQGPAGGDRRATPQAASVHGAARLPGAQHAGDRRGPPDLSGDRQGPPFPGTPAAVGQAATHIRDDRLLGGG